MREVVEKRRRDSKTFDLGDGRFLLRLQRGQHYADANGVWRERNMQARVDRGDLLIDQAPYALRISRTAPAYRYTSTTGAEVSVELQTGSSRPIPPVPEGRGYVYREIAPDVDWELVPAGIGVLANLVLKSASAQRSWRWTILGRRELISPIVAKDAEGKFCEITQTWDGDDLVVEWTGRVTDRRYLRSQLRGDESWTDQGVAYPVRIDPTVNESIVATGDDAWGYVGYASIGTAGNSDFVGWSPSLGFFRAGWRFTTVAVPQGATISSATLTLHVVYRNITNSPRTFRIRGDDVDNASAWATSNGPQHITTTTAYGQFSVPSGTASGTPAIDVQTVIQELVDRSGWSSSNAMRFAALIVAAGTGANSIGLYDYSAGASNVATLDIVYTTGGSTTNKSVSAALSLTASTVKSVQKKASAPASLTVSTVKSVAKNVSAAIGATVAALKSVSKSVSASALLTVVNTAVKVTVQNVSAAVSAVASSTATVGKIATAPVTATVSIARSVALGISAAVATTVSAVKSVTHSVSASAALTVSAAKTLTLSVSASIAASIAQVVRFVCRAEQTGSYTEQTEDTGTWSDQAEDGMTAFSEQSEGSDGWSEQGEQTNVFDEQTEQTGSDDCC